MLGLNSTSMKVRITTGNAIAFTTLAGSFDMPGRWKLQARVTLPSGTWLGETAELVVYNPFQ